MCCRRGGEARSQNTEVQPGHELRRLFRGRREGDGSHDGRSERSVGRTGGIDSCLSEPIALDALKYLATPERLSAAESVHHEDVQ